MYRVQHQERTQLQEQLALQNGSVVPDGSADENREHSVERWRMSDMKATGESGTFQEKWDDATWIDGS
jgi:hypothetical protein